MVDIKDEESVNSKVLEYVRKHGERRLEDDPEEMLRIIDLLWLYTDQEDIPS